MVRVQSISTWCGAYECIRNVDIANIDGMLTVAEAPGSEQEQLGKQCYPN